MAVPPVLVDLFDACHRRTATGQGGRTATSLKFYETRDNLAIPELESNSKAQSWVEEGIGLHRESDCCYFCSSTITKERREDLNRHFDDSWAEIRDRAQQILDQVAQAKDRLGSWRRSMPPERVFVNELRPDYRNALDRVDRDVNDRLVVLGAIADVLRYKVEDPSSTPGAPDWALLEKDLLAADEAAELVKRHNTKVQQFDELRESWFECGLDHIVGSSSKEFRELQEEVEGFKKTLGKQRDELLSSGKELEKVRSLQFTTHAMAETLTRDLARVYGRNHLAIAVTPDGKSYVCRRGDGLATNLSEGERTTLSLLYFLRRLEDAQKHDVDPSRRIVVIDDPSSSLDRESIFATHQWLRDSLPKFGQYIVLTHDFSLLRLFINSHKSAFNKSRNRIRDGNEAEVRFPNVVFLEMYCTSEDGMRRTKLGSLPECLLNQTSEYVYLFSMVMAGAMDGEDHERLFLLPNAARRMIEIFASYKAPHRSDFRQQLEALVQSLSGEPYDDVYVFCNRFSHGQGSQSVDVLDARAVHKNIRRCLEFLRAVDAEHFRCMCEAVGADQSVI